MSRVGKSEIKVPSTVSCVRDGDLLTFKGKLGEGAYEVPSGLDLEKTENGFCLTPKVLDKRTRILWGTTQRNIANIVKGVDQGFTVNIDLVGVGYRASVSSNQLVLQLGFSHDVIYPIPEGVSVKCAKPTSISITSSCKQQVGQIAAELRSYRLPEPYKGKGVIREGEFVLRKEGKKK